MNGLLKAMENTAELIVKYSGDIISAVSGLNASVEILSESYAIVTLPIENIDALYRLSVTEFIEVPKRLYFMRISTLPSICVYENRTFDGDVLDGSGTLIGIIDSGIDIANGDFIDENGSTRIAAAWAQTGSDGEPPRGFTKGIEYTREDINGAIMSGERTALYDTMGHGTAVAGIAAGNGRETGLSGVAPMSELIIVKLDENNTYSRSTDIMRGLKYIKDKAQQFGKPVAINISYGTNDGAHNGTSLFEGYIDEIASNTECLICIAAGNEGAAGHHYSGDFNDEENIVSFNIAQGLNNMYLSVWKSFSDEVGLIITSPSGEKSGLLTSDTQSAFLGTTVNVLFSQPTPYSIDSEIYLSFQSDGEIQSGIWSVEFVPINIVSGSYSIWLPVTEAVGSDTAFLEPNTEITITIPAAARKAMAVAGYNQLTDTYVDFSGRGYTRNIVYVKPDIAAPAYNVPAPLVGGGLDLFTGTSFAAPHAAGVAALVMQWGIVLGNDLFMYGEKLKAYLQRGAVRYANTEYPNPQLGYGKLCFENTMSLLQQSVASVAAQELTPTSISPFYSGEYYDFVQRQNSFIDNIEENENISICPINSSYNIVYVRREYYERNKTMLTNTYGIRQPFLLGLMQYETVLEKSGITNVQNQPYLNLRGGGVLVAVIDTGIDYTNSEFIYEDNTSKILYLWDQSDESGESSQCFGREYTNEDINRALKGEYAINSADTIGHGTILAEIAAGRNGAAPEAEMIIVKVKHAKQYLKEEMFLDNDTPAYASSDIMLGVSYAYKKADELNRPVVICMGMGTNQGGHSGQSSLEEYLSEVAKRYGVCLCVPVGNEGIARHHTSVEFDTEDEYKDVEITVAEGEPGINVWIWNFIVNSVAVEIISPLGEIIERLQPIPNYSGSVTLPKGGGVVQVKYFIPEDIASDQYTSVRIIRPAMGIWTIRLYNYNRSAGRIHLWLPIRGFIDENTFFLNPDPYFTVTTPATAEDVMVVGGYNMTDNSIYAASGRGPNRFASLRPYFCAPAVNINGRSGTSLASGVSAGAAALMMEWLILRNGINTANTMTITSYFVRGAVEGTGEIYPNNQWGYGMLNLYNSFENL